MKKIITMAMAITTSIAVNAQTQIDNSGFENWESVSGGSEPVNWNSFLTASGGLAGFAANQIEESTDKRPGSAGNKSVRIWSRSVLGVVANGNVTLGRINMGSSSPADANNYNKSIIGNATFSEAMPHIPDSIVFWVKFTPNGHTQNARMKATIHDNYEYRDPEDAASTSHVVASAIVNFPNTGGQWVRKSVPFNYTGPATSVNYLLVTFTTNQTPGGGAANDQLWIDDVELIYNPATFNTSNTTVCTGSTVTYTNTTSLVNPTSYAWSFPGGTPATSTVANPTVTYNTPGTYNATLTVTNQWGSKTVTKTNHVAVNAIPSPAFNYNQTTYCSNLDNPVPTTSSPGTFSSSPAGLTFANASTGEINLAGSTAGTYTITHTTSGACSSTATNTVTIFQGANASFSYPTNTICILGGDQTPSVTEAGGTFSAEPTGLTFVNASTGEIDVDGSTPGTYAVSYVRGGGCPDTVTVNITLTDTPDATFSYSGAAFCLNANDASPIYATGANAGVFSSTTGLNINSNTGTIDVSESTPGTYTVTNDIAAVGACPSASHSFDVTINGLPVVTFTLADDTICTGSPAFSLSGGSPAGGTYSGTGVGANIFNPAAFQAGTSTVITYTYTNTSTSCSNSATDIISIDGCLSIEETEAIESISVYPNPTNGLLKIDNIQSSAVYTVISISGQVVERGEISSSSNTIDMTHMQNGVYLLQLQQGENTQTVRVVKQ